MKAETSVDSVGRRNPAAWKAWARAQQAPLHVGVAVALFADGRSRKGGQGARLRRQLSRAARMAV